MSDIKKPLPNPQSDSTSKVRSYIDPQTGDVLLNKDDVCLELVRQVDKHFNHLSPLAKEATNSRLVMQESVDGLLALSKSFQKQSEAMLQEIRTTRMAVVSEISAIVGPLREVRKFFIDDNYEEEIIRLKEFVDLCERLQKLKESGFLDDVADTILRLAK